MIKVQRMLHQMYKGMQECTVKLAVRMEIGDRIRS